MNAEAKTLAEYRCPVCGHSDPNAYQRCNHPACPDGRDPRPIDRLSAPGEGVGLTRYEPFQGQFAVLMETSPEGEWVRFEDATAALAAKEAELAAAVQEVREWIGATQRWQRVANEAEAERYDLKARVAHLETCLEASDEVRALLSEPQASEGRDG